MVWRLSKEKDVKYLLVLVGGTIMQNI
jgi:hypothetical protein